MQQADAKVTLLPVTGKMEYKNETNEPTPLMIAPFAESPRRGGIPTGKGLSFPVKGVTADGYVFIEIPDHPAHLIVYDKAFAKKYAKAQ